MKRILILLLFAISTGAIAQGTRGATVLAPTSSATTGKTYAVIIGISTYQHIPQLKYADRDAKAFYDFLTSKSGGSVDSNNIKLLLNQQARRENMIRAINKWLMEDKKPQKGDLVYIYFAGHGDALPGIDSWLLGWDVPNSGDPHVDYDLDGGIQIVHLKRSIKLMADSGVKVILITDACRGNELPPGGEKGRDYISGELLASDMEMKAGLQFASCASGEVSKEDKCWGGGRGLFSYWFINGLYGMADENSDGYVTAGELSEYVKNKVKSASGRKDASGMIVYDQKPFYCCSENDDEVMAKVDAPKKQEVTEMINKKEGEEELLAFNGARGINSALSKFPDSVKTLYNTFEDEIQSDTSMDYNWRNYFESYNRINKYSLPDDFKANLKDELAVALYNHSQQVMNFYLENRKTVSIPDLRKVFINTIKCLDMAMPLIEKNNELYPKIKRNLFIFGSEVACTNYLYGLDTLTTEKAIRNELLNLDSAKALYSKPSAILFHNYERVYLALDELNKGAEYDSMASAIAPDWIYPYNGMGRSYIWSNQYQKAEKCYLKAFLLDSTWDYSIEGLVEIYMHEKEYNKAEKYCFSYLRLVDSVNSDYFYILGDAFSAQKKYETSKIYYLKAHQIDTANISVLFKLAATYNNLNDFNSKNLYLHKAFHLLDTLSADGNGRLGNIYYDDKQYVTSEFYLLKALKMGADSATTCYDIACSFSLQDEKENALKYFGISLKSGYKHYKHILRDTDLDGIRTTPEFAALMKKYFPDQYKEN